MGIKMPRFLVPTKLLYIMLNTIVSMPRCRNCDSFVTTTYVRVFAPNDAEQPRVSLSCEDIARDGVEVRKPRATRGN